MSLVFYYAPQSTASITTLILEELGIPCERKKLDIRAGETKKSEYLRVNPNGMVPCVVHDGVAIWESGAITMYLGETFGVEKKLWPGPGPRRGEAMKWVVWTNVTLGEAVYRWARNTQGWVPEEERNAKAGESGMADIRKHLKVLDGALEGRQFLAGEYTLADAHVSSFLDWLKHMKVDLAAYGQINAWSQRCAARPAVKSAMQWEK
ncbi:MAG: glutathione S-transferase family protein [Polyangiaceae bacterium]|jgi:glutathione S-transferase